MNNQEFITNDVKFFELPFYEANRFVPKNNFEPSKLEKIISQKLDRIIQNAPIVPGEYGEPMEKESLHSIVLRYPDDSHLIPIVEKQIFEKLSETQKLLSDGSRIIEDYTLMDFDPEFPTVEMEVDDNEIIRGETLPEHEAAHAREAVEAGQKVAYIVIPFIWKEEGNVQTLRAIHGKVKIMDQLSPESKLNIAIAPRYASQEDLISATLILQDLNGQDDSQPLWDKLTAYESGLPKYEGMGLKREDVSILLTESWRHKQEIKKRTLAR